MIFMMLHKFHGEFRGLDERLDGVLALCGSR